MAYTQDQRPLSVETPLGKDVLLLTAFTGEEGLSRPFRFTLELLAENASEVAFEKLLGQPITVTLSLPGEQQRHLNGICSRLGQGARDGIFTTFRMDVVPRLWLLSRRARSRIFQQVSVPDILRAVLAGLDVEYQINGTFHPRDYCVQYRETDLAFASRLLEEEGLYYFFRHDAGSHTMVIGNTRDGHPAMPGEATLLYEDLQGGARDEDRVFAWEKLQELRSGKSTLSDYCFELPGKSLLAEQLVADSVPAGQVTHKLKVARNEELELYDYPGGYAGRFDGVSPGGGDRSGDLRRIFDDNRRTVALRMEEETRAALLVSASSTCRQLTSGHRFHLERHFDADGDYVVVTAMHQARLADAYRSAEGGAFTYENAFTCIPAGLAFRPERRTPKPVVLGTQTAVVVGPAGEEIFTDKYSRVKVKFHWDRDPKRNEESSCWVRVSTSWAGRQWGAVSIPRVGHEVIVGFLEGDPDQPIILGSVYNADLMPPYPLPSDRTQSGVKSRSSPGGGPANFNEIRFEDRKDRELLTIHAERDHELGVENDRRKTVGHDETTTVARDRTESVGRHETINVAANRTETVGANETVSIGANRTESVGANEAIAVAGNRSETVARDETVSVSGDRTHDVGGSDALQVGERFTLSAGSEITLVTGAASLTLKKDGTISLAGKDIVIEGSSKVTVKASSEVTIKGAKVGLN